MDAATVLSQVDQEQFKQDVVSALTSGQEPLDPNVVNALNKLSRKKSFKLNELRELFLNRGHLSYFEPNEIIESVIEQKRKITEVKLYSQVMDSSKLSEKNLIVEVSGASFGYNSATGKFDQKVVWSKDISLLFRKFDNLVDCEQNSGSVNILSTLKHFLLEMKRLHLEDAEITQLLLYFAKGYLPHSYSALSRYQDNLNALFEELLNLANGDHELLKLRHSLMKLTRKPSDSLSSVLLVIGSLYNAIYNLTQPELSQAKVGEIVQRHKLYLLCAFVSKPTMEMLVSYSREQATKSRELNLLDIVSFVNRCEAVLNTCALTQECRMPPDGAILDQVAGGSVHLNTFSKIEPNLALGVFSSQLDSKEKTLSSHYSSGAQKSYSRGQRYNGSNRDGFGSSSFSGFGAGSRSYLNKSQRQSRPLEKQYGRRNSFKGSQRRSPSNRAFGNRSNSNNRSGSRSGSRSPRRQDNKSRSPSPYRKYNGYYTTDNLPRSPSASRSRSTSRERTCLRCGRNHKSSACRTYTEYCSTHCRFCNLCHRSHLCQSKSSGVKNSNMVQMQQSNNSSPVFDGQLQEEDDSQVNFYDLCL